MRPGTHRSKARRRAFSIFELLITLVIMGLIAGTGAIKMGGQVTRIRAQSEGDRLVSCLRWMREMAHSRGPLWQQGYGVYFWSNTTTQSCLQYSPYTPNKYSIPDDPVNNSVTSIWNLGLPHQPVTLGQLAPIDFVKLTPGELTKGLEIVFQSDEPGMQTYRPTSLPAYPNEVANGDWSRDRVVFWPPGVQAPLLPQAPWPQEYGATLPVIGNVTYNRIYILSQGDDPDNPDPTQRRMPVRIHIHPGTGMVRLMTPHERRDDGTW